MGRAEYRIRRTAAIGLSTGIGRYAIYCNSKSMIMAEGRWKEIGWALVVAGLLVAAPPRVGADSDTVQWAVLVYVEGAQDLEELSDTYQQYLDRVAFGEQVSAAAQLVEWVGPGSKEIRARRYLYNQAGRRSDVVSLSDSSPSARLANLIKWGMGQTVAEHYALVVAGHGQIAPVLPAGRSVAARPGLDEIGAPFSASDLREGLVQGLSGAQAGKIEIVFLDCCFGVTLEVAVGLKPVADYLVGSPGLMYSPGLPWDKILSWLAARPEASAHALARSAVQATRSSWQQEGELSLSLTAVELAGVEAICQRMETWAEAVEGRMAVVAPELTLARSRAENWGPGAELVDIGGFMTALSRTSNCVAVTQQARRVAQCVEQAVLASYLQGPLGPGKVRDRGLAVFFPLEVERWPEI
ncbi:MAG: hypothetical protein KAW89_08410, partial [Armatimonadetes bacterium]|nr:hypothetical protein [Armatimonadota bacterium]